MTIHGRFSGKTPLTNIRIARGISLWRTRRKGSAPVFFLDGPTVAPQPGLRNDVGGRTPFVRNRRFRPAWWSVPKATFASVTRRRKRPTVHVDGYLIDRYEVTEPGIQEVCRRGRLPEARILVGAVRERGSHHSLGRGGCALPRCDGSSRARDLGSGSCIPNGLEHHPVAGVSWYEAAAYAEYAGKSLPTVYHWMAAAQLEMGSLIVHGSNFRSGRTQPVGDHMAVSGSGTTDMAGNVKEWCWNEGGNGKRFILGGGFGDPTVHVQFRGLSESMVLSAKLWLSMREVRFATECRRVGGGRRELPRLFEGHTCLRPSLQPRAPVAWTHTTTER